MEPFKIGDLVVHETNGRRGTVAEVRFRGAWFVRIEGEPSGYWMMADSLRLYVPPV
jgi:hypothetical protein